MKGCLLVVLAVGWAFWELGRMDDVDFWLTLTVFWLTLIVLLSMAVLIRIYELICLRRRIVQMERALAEGKIELRDFRAFLEVFPEHKLSRGVP